MSLQDTLIWLANSGGGVMVVSFILEQLAWYQGLEAKAKKLWFFLFSAIVTIGGFVILTYVPKEYIDAASPYFLMIYSTFGAVFLGTGFHKLTKTDTTKG